LTAAFDLLRGMSRATAALMTLSVIGWLALAVWAGLDRVPLCGSAAADPASLVDLRLQLALTGVPLLLLSSATMIVAMMAPTLSGPMLHLWHRSLARHRWRAIALFMAGYLSVWLGVYGALFLMAQAARTVSGGATLLAVGLCVALLWQATPIRRHCLQRCHLRPRLSIFGLRALGDPLAFGLTSASWCAATCWAWMLVPFCANQGRPVLMLAVGIMIAAERTLWRERRYAPLWRTPALAPALNSLFGFGKALTGTTWHARVAAGIENPDPR
jgi:predicted metal-binding membrane protein